MSSWYERNDKTESTADPRLFYGAIFNSYQPNNGSPWPPVVAAVVGYALGSLAAKAKGK